MNSLSRVVIPTAVALTLAVIGAAGVIEPRVLAVLAIVPLLTAWAWFSIAQPASALRTCFVLVLVANTKFRDRDAWASLAGSVDLQVALELALYGAIGVTVAAAWLSERRPERHATFAEAVPIAYSGLALCSTLWSVVPSMTLVRAVQSFILAGFTIVTVRQLSAAGALRAACAGLIRYALVCSAIAALFPSTVLFNAVAPVFQFTWFDVHPITAGTLLALAALAILVDGRSSDPAAVRRYFGIPNAVLLTVLCGLLVMSRSRGPLAAFIVAVVVLAILRSRLPARYAVATLTGIAALLLSVALLAGWSWTPGSPSVRPGVLEAFVLRDQGLDEFASLSGRRELWNDLLPFAARRPLLGYGYQAARVLTLDAAAWAGHAHNAALQSQLDLGLIGVVLLATLVATAAATLWRRVPIGGEHQHLAVSVFVMTVFLIVNATTSESFAGAPGFETTLMFLVGIGGGRLHAA